MPVGRGGPSLFWPGVLVGIGIAGTLHEVVLHQLLALAGTLLLRPTRQPSRSPHHPGPSRRPSVHSASTPTRSAAPPARVA
jgi:hypothetical protein